jgi:hypothetical protein
VIKLSEVSEYYCRVKAFSVTKKRHFKHQIEYLNRKKNTAPDIPTDIKRASFAVLHLPIHPLIRGMACQDVFLPLSHKRCSQPSPRLPSS